jgi:type II secretory pathway pseudopilin PulG
MLKQDDFGFTIVELLVGLGIVMLLVAGGVMSMGRFASRDKVIAAKNEVVSGIKLARNYAMTMQRPSGFTTQLDSVMIVINAGVMSAYPVTKDIMPNVNNPYFSKKIASNDMVITPIMWGTLAFSVPEGKLLNYASSMAANPTFPVDVNYRLSIGISPTDVAVGETRTVIVFPQGTINEK